MVVIPVDLSTLIWNYLKTNAAAASLRALLVSGSSSVLEAGDVGASLLDSRESTRRTGGNMNLALILAIQDGGSDPHEHPDKEYQYAVVRAYDRDRGYRNIRTVRMQLIEILKGLPANVGPMGTRGLMSLDFTGRTGHRFDTTFAIDYEAITYTGIVIDLVAD